MPTVLTVVVQRLEAGVRGHERVIPGAQAGDEALLAPRELAGRHQQGRVIR